MKRFILITAIAALMSAGGPALAAQCKGANGKAVKCPAKAAAIRKACTPTKAKPCGKYRAKVQNPSSHTGYKW